MENIIENKSLEFAIRIVNLCKFLKNEKVDRVLTNQILKSGTSIGANVAEAQNAQSNNDFISKMSIALKEASETKYWLKLLYRCECIDKKQYVSLYDDCEEIYKIISSIVLSSKEKSL